MRGSAAESFSLFRLDDIADRLHRKIYGRDIIPPKEQMTRTPTASWTSQSADSSVSGSAFLFNFSIMLSGDLILEQIYWTAWNPDL